VFHHSNYDLAQTIRVPLNARIQKLERELSLWKGRTWILLATNLFLLGVLLIEFGQQLSGK
jgi:hypothetical protein